MAYFIILIKKIQQVSYDDDIFHVIEFMIFHLSGLKLTHSFSINQCDHINSNRIANIALILFIHISGFQ
jgi:hypothetical protein